MVPVCDCSSWNVSCIDIFMIKVNKRQSRIIAFWVVASMLLAVLFPVHLHVHNHYHEGSNSYVSSEIEFLNFEKNPFEEHKHAKVSDIGKDFFVKKNAPDADLALLVFLLVLILSLVYFRKKPGTVLRFPALKYSFLRPVLRAPPSAAI